MSEAEYQIERNLERTLRIPSFNSVAQIDTRSILERFSSNEIKRIALEMYNEGLRTDEKFEKMNIQLMNASYELSAKQKNALITFVMYAN